MTESIGGDQQTLPLKHGATMVPRAVPVTAGLLAVVGGVIALALGFANPISIGFVSLAGLILLIGVPQQAALGTAACIAAIAMFTFAPNLLSLTSQVSASGIASAVLIIGLLRRRGVPAGRKRSVAGLLIAIAYFVLLYLTTVFNGLGTDGFVLVVVFVVPSLLGMIVARLFTMDDMRVFARGFIAFALVQVLVGAIDLFVVPIPFLGYTEFSGERPGNPLFADALPRAQGLASHPILMALILILAIIFIWRSEIVRASAGVRLFLIGVLVFGLALSGTRSAILALIVGVLFLAIISPRTIAARIRNLLVVVSAVSLSLLNPTVLDYVGSIVNGLSESDSYTHRSGAFQSVPLLLSDQDPIQLFFGSGAGSEPTFFARGLLQQDGFNIIDNQFVTSLVVVGLVGVSLVIVLALRSLVYGGPMLRALALVLLVMFNSFDLLRTAGPEVIFFLLVGWTDNPLFRTGFATNEEGLQNETSVVPNRGKARRPQYRS